MFTRLMAALSRARSSTENADDEYNRYFDNFQTVLAAEHAAIDERRAAQSRPPSFWPPVDENKIGGAKRPMYEATGMSLSGGGIRSAAFCLGVLQNFSLDKNRLFDRLDYLSTVSGGGYIGSSLSAAMAEPTTYPQSFPFVQEGRFDDEPSLGHIRDYSNYLLPRGQKSFGDAIAVVSRGLATNVIIVLAFVLFAAMLTLVAYPTAESLHTGSFLTRFLLPLDPETHPWVRTWLGDYPFAFTLRLFLVLVLYNSMWALGRAWYVGEGSDVRGDAIKWGRRLLFVVLFSAVLDLQPLAISGMVWLKANGMGEALKLVSAAAAPFAGIVAFFSSRIAAFLKQSSQDTGTGTMVKRLTSFALIMAAAAVLPLLLWAFYLWVCVCGMPDTEFNFPAALDDAMMSLSAYFGHHTWAAYAVAAAPFWLVMLWLAQKPNANSLHQLYRDKLSKAFLFDPRNRYTKNAEEADDQDLIPRDDAKLSEISPATGGPYQLINATLNLQGSAKANRRGRDASFFLFSSKFTGSDVTGYVDTPTVEDYDPHINLGSAMAISGAAVSSDMGAESVAPLAPTLALLNLRLGYWMTNPAEMRDTDPADAGKKKRASLWSRLYLLAEMFGRLDETAHNVYLTDGGHIENLGLYELLKRHCSVIFVVDGEADPKLGFHALAIAERYARIDLGVRIDLPWRKIADVANAATKSAEKGEPIPSVGGPHCAVGSILYPGGEKGVLVYVKASLTGDEPDYVVDYKTRNPAFPHESTGDQFFTEEQFEVYRALGFHALDGFLSGKREFTCNIDVALSAALGFTTVPDFVKSRFPA